MFRLGLIVPALLIARLVFAADPPLSFNRDIRPIFSDRCYACHGPDARQRQAGLRLDNEAIAKSALASGHIPIVAGDPLKSALYQRISSSNKAVRMPPSYSGREPLTTREIQTIRKWIEQGAVWQQHWSFIPPVRPNESIDAMVAARLAEEGLKPSPRADPATLLRRVTLDLTGLPPTPEQLADFLKNPAPAAYEKVVDRLLASHAYAERMAYRWMEVARYADTNGYQMDGNRDMWRWRDWVINAFDRNMPFDQFTIEQIAGDLLPNPTLDQRIATAFHRNHRTNSEGGIVPEEFRVEYVADRVETTATVWMGLTLGCARCHDHKYDPLTQKDFYRMFAFFNNVSEKGLVYNWGNDDPLIKAPTPEQQKQLAQFDGNAAAAKKAYAALAPALDTAQTRWEKKIARGRKLDWTPSGALLYQQSEPAQFDGTHFLVNDAAAVKLDYLSPFTFSAWIKPQCDKCAILSKTEDYAEGQGHGLYIMDGKLRLHVIFRWTDIGMRVESEDRLKPQEWQHVTVTYDGKRYASGVHMYVDGRPLKVRILFDELNWPMDIKQPVRIGAGGGLRFKGSIEDARIYARDLDPKEVGALSLKESVNEIAARPPRDRSGREKDKLRLCFLDAYAPNAIREARAAVQTAQAERDRFEASLPTVMVMSEDPKLRKTYVLKRGAYDAHGDQVTAGVPAILPQLPPDAPQNRLGLARWLVDRRNPLTARVTVNRLWQTFFGTGLVKTVEDFGSQGEWPVYPDVLDWLAVEFMDSGWDLKHIVKTIVMTDTYCQSSKVSRELEQRDPDNRLLARGPRFRLPAEMIRDQALFVSGLLVDKVGGPSVKPYQPPGLWQELAGGKGYVQDHGDALYRRSLYTFWKRTVAPPSAINFDSPTRETCTVRESRTNTPLQALTLMNEVTYVEAARKLAEAMLEHGGSTPQDRITYAYLRALARPPRPEELRAVSQMLAHFEERYQAGEDQARELLTEGESKSEPKLDAPELAAYTAVASLLFNLDEMVTKE